MLDNAMKILIISSCTGKKKLQFKEQLSLQDFQKGNEHITKMEQKYAKYLLPAEQLYTGQQHVRMMEAVNKFRNENNGSGEKIEIDIYILSAGYGLIPGDKKILPYEVTFNSFNASDLAEWANALKIPADFRSVLTNEYDLAVVILGENYWKSCYLDTDEISQIPVLCLCSKYVKDKISLKKNFFTISLSNKHAKVFRCGMIGLKGYLISVFLKDYLCVPITVDITEKIKNFCAYIETSVIK
jgi:hypothetical protein